MQVLKIQKGLQRTFFFYFQHISGKVIAESLCYEKKTEFTTEDTVITLMHLQNHVANQDWELSTSPSSVQIKFSWFQEWGWQIQF